MTSTAHDPSGDPRWSYRNSGPWGCWNWHGRGWNGDASDPRSWAHAHPFAGPHFPPKPLLIVATVLGFVWWWPVGLALLAVTLCRRSMLGCRRWAAWHNAGGHHAGGAGWKQWFDGERPSSGNRAFDDYRAETLRRLEEEQKEFTEFLERLRVAKDKAEFDQFMKDRRTRPSTTPPESPAPSM